MKGDTSMKRRILAALAALAFAAVRESISRSGKIDIELYCATQANVSARFPLGETPGGAFQPTFETTFFQTLNYSGAV